MTTLKKGTAFNTPSGVYYIIRINPEKDGMLKSYELSHKPNSRKGCDYSIEEINSFLNNRVWEQI